MNFYKHYIGDFQRDTGHLSLTERGAYLCLMHHYYATEKPLPNDHAALCRIAGAIDKAERLAVQKAMGFFTPVESGLMHSRIEAEIEKAGKQADTNRQIALDREARRKAEREQHEASTNRATKREPNQTPDTSNTVSGAKAPSSAEPTKPGRPAIPCPYDAIVALYHEKLPGLPRVRLMNASRQKALRKTWGWVLSSTRGDGSRRAETAEQALEWLSDYFARASDNDFLMGREGRSPGHEGWTPDLDFLLTEKGMKHVIEKTREAA